MEAELTSSSSPSTSSPKGNGSSPDGSQPKRASETRIVLVCDDDALTRDGLALRLHAEGYEVITTESVDESLAVMRERDVLAVIADLHLPGGADGTALLASARRWYPATLRFLLTADISGAAIADAWYSTWIDKDSRADTHRLLEMLRGAS